jgi:diamine N-acetyltransferase
VRILIGNKSLLGKGYGTEALLLISDFAFYHLNLHKIYAFVLASNKRARKSFEKAGFSLEGTLKGDRFVNDKYEDVYYLGKSRK